MRSAIGRDLLSVGRDSSRRAAAMPAGRVVTCLAWLLVTAVSRGQSPPRLPSQQPAPGYRHAVFRPVGLKEAAIEDAHWRPAIDRSRQQGVLDYLQKFETAGFIQNYRIAAEGLAERHAGGPNNNEFVYKLMEAAGYYANSSEEVARTFGRLNRLVLATQCDDGYLNTYYENPLVKRGGGKRFQSLNRFEFYNFGHFTQAAIAWHRTTGDDAMLEAAIEFADLIVERFGAPNRLPYKLNQGPPNKKYEHPNHEMAMVELYRVTGDRRYLEFAKHTLDQYGFWDFEEIYGHAVQETLLLTGGADVYLEYGRAAMLDTLTRLWDDMHRRKMYVTGAVGSTGRGEAYGQAYQLPNRTAYAETCAAISMVFWNYRMLLATGQSKYADCLERALYNGVASGISLSGTEYFYRNPLECPPGDPGKNRRVPFFGCSCCPPNVHRLYGSLQQYTYTRSRDGIAVHLYIGSSLETELADGRKISLRQETRCPHDGLVQLAVDVPRETAFTLRLRIPDWIGASGVAGDLYRYAVTLPETDRAREAAWRLQINGKWADAPCENGYAVIRRAWKPGDKVALHLPMPVRRVRAHEKVEANRGRVAIQRGPIVYCAEGVDNGGRVDNIELPRHAALRPEYRPDLLGGVTVLVGEAQRIALDDQGVVIQRRPTKLTLIPYHVWANRGSHAMAVWLREE